MQRAEAQDVGGISGENAVVDNPGVQEGQIEVEDRLDGLQPDQHGEEPAVGAEMGAKQAEQHESPRGLRSG